MLYELKLNGEKKFSGTSVECYLELHRKQSKSQEQALKEGWSIEPVSMEARIHEVTEQAELKMWDEVARNFPEIKTGDFPFDASFELTQAIEKAVKLWVESNS